MTTTAVTARPSNSQPPALASDELRRKIDAISSRVGYFAGKPRLIDCEVGPKTRAEFQARQNLIDASLAHRDSGLLEMALMQLFALTKLNRQDAESPEDLAKLYAAHLGGLPTWAVVAACKQLAEGQGESLTFAPAAPEIFTKAREIIGPALRERSKVAAILEAAERSQPLLSVNTSEAERRAERVKAVLADFERRQSEQAA